MFRLIKLCFYAFLGYALYELFQGMRSGSMRQERSSRGGQRRGQGQGGRGRMTGGRGEGRREVTAEPSGTSQAHSVGRGVVR
jgi:hypothetical protein